MVITRLRETHERLAMRRLTFVERVRRLCSSLAQVRLGVGECVEFGGDVELPLEAAVARRK
eukprot:3184994-Prymnesium_polylepis.1